jgi:hypothetical protein
MMHRRFIAIAAAIVAAAPAAHAAPGGSIRTMPLGNYACELPGDALGPAVRRVPESDFTIVNDSSYSQGANLGTYLMTGDSVVITSGPLRGWKFRRVSKSFLQKVDNKGVDEPLRCVRQIYKNSE